LLEAPLVDICRAFSLARCERKGFNAVSEKKFVKKNVRKGLEAGEGVALHGVACAALLRIVSRMYALNVALQSKHARQLQAACLAFEPPLALVRAFVA
jgi:hypothetical protein